MTSRRALCGAAAMVMLVSCTSGADNAGESDPPSEVRTELLFDEPVDPSDSPESPVFLISGAQIAAGDVLHIETENDCPQAGASVRSTLASARYDLVRAQEGDRFSITLPLFLPAGDYRFKFHCDASIPSGTFEGDIRIERHREGRLAESVCFPQWIDDGRNPCISGQTGDVYEGE